MCGRCGDGRAPASADPRAPVRRIRRPRRPAALPQSRSGVLVCARTCSGRAPPASRSRDRTAASAGHRGLRTMGSSRPGPAIQTPSSARSPQKPATSAERAEPSSLLDRQDGPLSLIAADHLQRTFPMTRGWADLYAWQLDRASRTPLTRQIYMQVRSAVLSGALRPGTRMPSSRAMASKLGVARASVVLAYQHLLAEGYVESRHGSGTFIAGDLTGLASQRRGATRATKRAVPTSAQTFSDFERSAVQSDARPFNTGRTLIDARTAETWRSLTHRAVRRLGANDFGYTDPAGLAELRENICDYLRAARAVRCDPEQIVITGRHPASNRHRNPCAARARRRGVGRGSWLSADPRAVAARQGAAASHSGRCPGSGRRRRHAHGTSGARSVRHALASVSDRRCAVHGAAPGAVGVGAAERRIHRRGRLHQRVPLYGAAARI